MITKCHASLRIVALFLNIRLWCILLWGLLARSAEAEDSKRYLHQLDGAECTLALNSIAALPSDVIVLGGSFAHDSVAVETALWRSEDAGRSWSQMPVHIWGSEVSHLHSVGSRFLFGLIQFRKEGTRGPTHIIKSDDTGKTWTVMPHRFRSRNLIDSVSGFNFYGPDNGILITDGLEGVLKVYTTDDGGVSWKELWEIESGEVNGKYLPPHDTGFREVDIITGDSRRLTALLRGGPEAQFSPKCIISVDYDEDEYAIDQLSVSGQFVKNVGKINRKFRVIQNTFSPIK